MLLILLILIHVLCVNCFEVNLLPICIHFIGLLYFAIQNHNLQAQFKKQRMYLQFPYEHQCFHW